MITPIPGNPLEEKIKTVLNGGKNELDSAIVPFTFGFDQIVVDKKPTHVLVIDRTLQEAESECLWSSDHYYTNKGRRYFFDLSKPGNHFIEFFKSGEHNLIFLFFSFTEEKYFNKKKIAEHEEYYLKKSKSYGAKYEHEIRRYEFSRENDGIIGFCEKDVYIPSEFFSQVPESVFSKLFYDWVNQWRREKPMDDCDFRNRALRACSYELIPRIIYFFVAVFLYFIGRAALAVLLSATSLIIKTIEFVFGIQNKNFLKGLGDVWTKFVFSKTPNFPEMFMSFNLFCDKETYNADAVYNFKELHIGKKTFYLPISILGALMLFVNISGILFCISHFPNYVSLLFVYVGWLVIQIPIIIETSNFVEKFRSKNLFKLQFTLKDSGETKYDLFSRNAFFLFVGVFISFIVFQLFNLGIVSFVGHELYLVFTNKITLIIVGVVFFGVLFGLNAKKATKSIVKGILKLLGIIWKVLKPVLKAIDSLLLKLWIKLDEYLQSKFPPAPIIEKKSSGDEYKDWLSNSYNFDRDLSTVTASTLPKAQTAKGRVVQTFKSKFWNTKSQICKPYEH